MLPNELAAKKISIKVLGLKYSPICQILGILIICKANYEYHNFYLTSKLHYEFALSPSHVQIIVSFILLV